jgi:beta-galactosidase/beta-glucuronidase
MNCIKYYLLFHLSLFTFCLGFAQTTQVQYLSGHGKDDMVQWQFYCTEGRNSGKWTTIGVPSCWELQGFGKYNYGFNKDSAKGREKGLYKYNFQVPAAWKGRVVNLVFEGSMTDTEVKVNGQPAGDMHQGSFYAFRYNISALLQYGSNNLLEVTVAKHSANQSVNEAERKADFWIFGGIFRPVFLEALPVTHISQLKVDAKANGHFKALVNISAGGGELITQLYDGQGKAFGSAIRQKVTGTTTVVQQSFTAPALWSAEFPHLYKAVFTLYRNGKALHTIHQKFGFRTVEVKQRDGIYVNGVKVKMKGVNRHSFWPTSGRTTSRALSIEDVLLMKDMNMNSVRSSHYPPDAHFLDICDSLGLYVMDELAGWHGHYNTPTGSKLVKEMIDHDVNHPSIIFWANGNEGGHNFELDHWFTELDPQQRPVVHPWQLFGGFDTQHYRDYNYGIGNYMNGHDIVMPTEFLHGLYDGGHGAGLEDYWEAMWSSPLSAGGFLWDFADEGVVRTDKDGVIDTDGNHGADGIVGPYHEKEGSYYTIKEVWSPVYFQHREITPAFDGVFTIENRYAFTNTSQCSFTWKLVKYAPAGSAITAQQTGVAAAPAIKPTERGLLKLNLPKDFAAYHFLYVTVKGPDGKDLYTWSWPVAKPKEVVPALTAQPGIMAQVLPQYSEHDTTCIATAAGTQYTFSKQSGLLLSVIKNGKAIPFNNGPVLSEGSPIFDSLTHTFSGANLVITAWYNKKSLIHQLVWTVLPSGWLKMDIQYFPAEYTTTLAGVNFSFPEAQMQSVNYMGKGPYRVWKNRLKGPAFGVWNKTYNTTETGELPFAYPEFKGYHANLYWCRFITKDQPFLVATETEDVFLRLFTPKVLDDPKDTWKNLQYYFPDGDISFMQGISSVGTKTQKNLTTGPMGMKNILYDYEKDPSRALHMVLWFYFEELK